VSEIVNEANQEHKNEEELSKIDQEWKTQSFELKQYKKGAEVRGYVLNNTEDIR
jgi:dynein heavy chain